MKPRTVVVLALVVAALGAFIWFVERDLPSSEEIAERSRKVLPVEPEEVEAVIVEWQGERVRLERAASPDPEDGGSGEGEDDGPRGALAPDEWRVTEPFRARADRTAVDGLLTAVGGLDKARTLEDADPAEVGLAEPRGRVTLVTEDGERTLQVGRDVPASENVLVSLAEAPEVHVTGRSFIARLERAPGEWRSKDVFSVARDDVARVRLRSTAEGGERSVVLARGDDGRFRLEEPVSDVAASDAVDRLLSDLVTLRAQRFVDGAGDGAAGEEGEGEAAPETPPDPAELGLEPPRAVVEAELRDGGEALRVELGAPVGEGGEAVYARAAGQLFEAVTDLDDAAARPAREWRSRSWTEMRSFDVNRIEATGPEGEPTVALTRDGTDWKRGEETIPHTAGSDLVFAVTDADGELAGGEGADPGQPLVTFRLTSREGREVTLTLFPAVEAPEGAASGDAGAGRPERPDAGPEGTGEDEAWESGAEEAGGRVHPARNSSREALLLLPADAVEEILQALEEVRTAEPVTEETGGDGDEAADSE